LTEYVLAGHSVHVDEPDILYAPARQLVHLDVYATPEHHQ